MTYHLEDQLSAYMDDELAEEERQQVEAHLESCESCQALLDELLSIQQSVMHTFERMEAPADLEIRVLQTLTDTPKPAAAGKAWLFLPLAACIALGTVWFMTGAVVGKAFHAIFRLMVALVYVVPHFVSGVPILYGLTVVLSLLIISTSIYSLRRLILTSTS